MTADRPDWSFVSSTGELLKAGPFTDAENFSDGLAAVRAGDKWGFIDSTGRYAIQPSYLLVKSFSEGLAAFCDKPDHWGFLDKTGKVVVPPRYTEVTDCHDGLVGVWNGSHGLFGTNGAGGYLDAKGSLIIPMNYFGLHHFSNGLAKVCDYGGHHTRFIDTQGKPIIHDQPYRLERDFHDGLAVVHDASFGFIDTAGKVVIPCVYEWANDFSQGRALVRENPRGLWSVIDQKGQVLLDGKITQAAPEATVHAFHEGLLRVDAVGNWRGYIDLNCKKAIQLQPGEEGGDFVGGLAIIAKKIGDRDGGKSVCTFRYVDRQGKTVFSNELVLPKQWPMTALDWF